MTRVNPMLLTIRLLKYIFAKFSLVKNYSCYGRDKGVGWRKRTFFNDSVGRSSNRAVGLSA